VEPSEKKKFIAVGVFGLPFIPVYINPLGQSEINLKTTMRVQRGKDFSVAYNPCFVSPPLKPICPYNVDISAEIYLSVTKNEIDFLNTLTIYDLTTNDRINMDKLYQSYGRNKIQKWEMVDLTLTYRYKCDGVCPDDLQIEAENFAMVDHQPVSSTDYHVHKNSHGEYIFMVGENNHDIGKVVW
jgi:hypothetical protein